VISCARGKGREGEAKEALVDFTVHVLTHGQ
jgi:hypothetical protein